MGTFNYVVQQIQQWSMYIHKNTLNFDYYKFTFFCNRALTTWHMFSNRLFLEGLNMKRAMFLLICAIEKQGFLIPSLLTGQHTAPNVPSPSIPLCLTWSSSQWPFQYTWLWHLLRCSSQHLCGGQLPGCSNVALSQKFSHSHHTTCWPCSIYEQNQSPEDFNNRNEDCSLPYYLRAEAKLIFQSQKLTKPIGYSP